MEGRRGRARVRKERRKETGTYIRMPRDVLGRKSHSVVLVVPPVGVGEVVCAVS